jgi:hypothetical protein
MHELRSNEDIIRARLQARDMARSAGLGVMDQTRFATAVSELGRNAVRYGVGGACEFTDLSDARQVRLQARVSDHGPGIADIARAKACPRCLPPLSPQPLPSWPTTSGCMPAAAGACKCPWWQRPAGAGWSWWLTTTVPASQTLRRPWSRATAAAAAWAAGCPACSA